MAKKCNTADAVYTNMSDALQQVMEKNNTDAFISIGRKRAEFVNPFVLLFYDNLDNVIRDYNLTGTDIRILLIIMKKMQKGNLLSISFAQIAKDIDLPRQNVYRTKKKFMDSQLILEINGELYINPHVIAKGDWSETDRNSKNIELVNNSYELMQNNSTLTCSILTSNIKTKERKKKQRKAIKDEIDKIIDNKNSDDILEEIKSETDPLFEKQ